MSKITIFHRLAGQGSLGRERWTAVTMWRGKPFAVEAKALAPSASIFARGGMTRRSYYMRILDQAVRARDPYVKVVRRQILRRLAPEFLRIELTALMQLKDERLLLQSMGFETANIHLGTPGAQAAVLADLDQRDPDWLFKNASKMAQKVRKGHNTYARRFARNNLAWS